MGSREAFVLLDDARGDGAADARVYERPARVFVAHRPEQVEPVLAAAQAALAEDGGTLAGHIAYEAGLALEPRLRDRAPARTGAAGPLVWLGLFAEETRLPAGDVPGWLAARAGGAASLGPLDPTLSPGGYRDAFATVAEKIRAGDIYQGNLTFPLAGSYRGDPLALYAALRPAAQAGCGGVVFDGSHWLLSLSPELFVSLQDGTARARPMKGTRPRDADPARDAAMANELAVSGKERAENLMIVDLMRNDLSRVARAGSVKVAHPFAVESYPTVHQMVTTVTATLAEGSDAVDLIRALFPCGSVTGAPKIRAMELIDAVERDARGPYCGAIGRIGADGTAAFNVAIRTLRLTPVENGQGHAVLAVGSAIVADSDADAEWREAVLKGGFARASGPDRTAPGFDLIETMRFDPEEGIALLEAHLARLKASAEELGFAFDRHALRNQIQALCFDLDAPTRVRLACARSGAVALEAAPLPPALPDPVRCIVLPLPVDPGDWRLRHKTSDRGFYADARAVALAEGADEALFVTDDGLLTEGSFTSILAGPQGDYLTPSTALGLLPGVQRGALIASGAAREGAVRLTDLDNGFHLCNALRGTMHAELMT
ncbi:aminodeoxychorismate synthase component I [Erythrobacter sp. LQ02-29]|uniref:aminodeoxychorismate synthase component I n=1 Tax=Erythrobacter sp. LQ02-29 TaxID=2920384 RepID=UPI001F4E5785|nr:aminodeoxychorismate synthase component I [Erythrobacter sp. LQ02-29]MCP9222005.1 aminodeoxychorismate synthase component I [Erythrobacter sp. LQ02-29]